MSIYDYNLTAETLQLTPPNKRTSTTLALLSVSDFYFQKLHDLFFTNYADGDASIDYAGGTTYVAGDHVRYVDNKIYERRRLNLTTGAVIGNTTGIIPTNTDNWIVLLNNFIGVRERSKYKSNRVVFEWALNKWFKTTFRQFTGWDGSGNPTPLSDIYIQNIPVDLNSFIVGVNEAQSSDVWASDVEQQVSVINLAYFFNAYMFSINIPTAIYNALLPAEPAGITTPKDNVVRAFADNYTLGGITYLIKIY